MSERGGIFRPFMRRGSGRRMMDDTVAPVEALVLGECQRVLPTLPPASVSACITDPPYNYEFVGHRWDAAEIERRRSRAVDSSTLVRNLPYGSGLAGGKRDARWYARNRANVLEYGQWLTTWTVPLARACRPGAYVAVFNSARTAAHVQVALESAGFYARDVLVWRRPSGIPRGLNASAKLRSLGDPRAEQYVGWHSALRTEWEAVVLVQKPLIGNYLDTVRAHGTGLMHTDDGEGGFRSNILTGFRASAADRGVAHPTVKPLALMQHLVDLLVPPGAEHIVLDPFAGSGTTLLAARNAGNSFVGIERDAGYLAIAEARLAAASADGETGSASA